MLELTISRGDSLYSVLHRLNIVNNLSDFWRLINSSTPIFINNKRVKDYNETIEFVAKHEYDKLFDRLSKSFILDTYASIRIGGSLDPEDDRYGTKIYLKREGSNPDKVEVFN